MAKIKTPADFVSFDFSAIPAVLALEAELREAFAMTNEIKDRLQAVLSPIIVRMGPTLTAEDKVRLHMDETGKVAPGHTFKYGYRGGIAVATVPASKAKAGNGIKATA
jgi:anti-sigma factor RsiW